VVIAAAVVTRARHVPAQLGLASRDIGPRLRATNDGPGNRLREAYGSFMELGPGVSAGWAGPMGCSVADEQRCVGREEPPAEEHEGCEGIRRVAALEVGAAATT